MVVTVDKGIVDSIRKDGCIAKKCNNHHFYLNLVGYHAVIHSRFNFVRSHTNTILIRIKESN